MSTFVKQYPDEGRAGAAVAHLLWLSALESGVRLPALRYHRGTRVGPAPGLLGILVGGHG